MDHSELRALHKRLSSIFASVASFQLPITRFPVLDSSFDVHTDPTNDSQWVQNDNISIAYYPDINYSVQGLKKLRDTIRVDIDVLEKFLDDPRSANISASNAPNSNAPYLIQVWNEFLSAPQPVVSIFKSFTSSPPDTRNKPDIVRVQNPGVKVDIVARGGLSWIRINTTKNTRLLAEFREIDSYMTDSDSDSDEGGSLRQTEFDNSILKMARDLLAAAKVNPVELIDDIGIQHTPTITLRLTRLDPNPQDERLNDPRIAQTIQCLHDMGITVELGERKDSEIPSFPTRLPPPPLSLIPSLRINLDLSLLIALVSDTTHDTLPLSMEAAKKRFLPPKRAREWKKRPHSDTTPEEDEDLEESENSDIAKHSRALTNQLMQEMGNSMIHIIHDLLASSKAVYPSPDIEFWTTPEAKDRCLRIVTKIGGPNEKRRVHALFDQNREAANVNYWGHSRFPSNFFPLLPIRVFPANHVPMIVTDPQPQKPDSAFFTVLSRTCTEMLRVDGDANSGEPADGDKIQRAVPMKANGRLTAHTVRSMLWGARLGITTLTANRTSVRAILREITARSRTGSHQSLEESFEQLSLGQGDKSIAAVWLVDPRSLAADMRSDLD